MSTTSNDAVKGSSQRVGTLSFRVEPPPAAATAVAPRQKSQLVTTKHTKGTLTFRVEAPEPSQQSTSAETTLSDALGLDLTGAPAPPKQVDRHILESRKVQLEPGFSQVAWMQRMGRFRKSRARRISPEELRSHCDLDSLWIAYKGIVYDCTRYVP